MTKLNLGLSSGFLFKDGGGKAADQLGEPETENTREWQQQR